MLMSAIVLSASLFPIACVEARTPAQVYLSTERTVASMRLECSADDVTIEDFAGMTRIAHGCGKQVMVTCLEPGSFAGPTGECFPMQDLRTRAAFELSCDPNAVELTPLDAEGHTVGVNGCGARAVYQYVKVGQNYNWTLSTKDTIGAT
jgi:hypothetical protein